MTVERWINVGKPKGYKVETPYGWANVHDGRQVYNWYEILVKSDKVHGWMHSEARQRLYQEDEPCGD